MINTYKPDKITQRIINQNCKDNYENGFFIFRNGVSKYHLCFMFVHIDGCTLVS